MSDTSHEHIQSHVKTYIKVFAALAVGTIVTVWASNFHLGIMLGIIVALIIATVKGSLVASFFMHLSAERKTDLLGADPDGGVYRGDGGSDHVRALRPAGAPTRDFCRAARTRAGASCWDANRGARGVNMSLKAFHIFFITISVLLCFGFGAWCLESEYAKGQPAYAITGYVSFALGVALVVYEILFLRKFKENGARP